MLAFVAALVLAVIARPVPDTARALPSDLTEALRSESQLSVPISAISVPDTAPAAPGETTRAEGKTGPGDGAGDGSLEIRRKAIATEIVKIGASLRRGIETGDADAILARVPSTGLRCGDRVVPRARVERDLRTRGSWLHEVMFGDAGPSPRAPRSLRAFLKAVMKAVPDTAIVVGFRRDPRAGPVGRPCLDYRAEGFTTPGAPLCFDRHDGKWWLIDSLYPCG